LKLVKQGLYHKEKNMSLNGPATILFDLTGSAITQFNPLPVTLSGVPLGGNVSVVNFPVTQSVAVTNFPAVQQVTGSISISQTTVQKIAGTVLSGSTADGTNGPVVVAGVDNAGIVRTMLLDTTGRQIVYQKSSSSAVTSVVSSATNVTLLSSNVLRQGGTVYNDSTSTMYLKLGVTATNANFTVKIMPQGYYELPYGYTGQVDAIWTSANGNARITELT
jgi:hypothetical protein